MIHARYRHQGFTLIELMLAMTFVSVLLLAIAMTIIQVGAIYSKGMALKDINQSARLISEDLRRTVASAGVVSLDTASYVVTTIEGTPISGRLCLGNYSYIWNTIDAKPELPEAIKTSAASDELVGIAKVPDPSKVYCAVNGGGGGLAVQSALRSVDESRSTELLTKGDHSLAVTSFSVTTSPGAYDQTTGQRLFTIEYGIGTGDPVAMKDDRTGCLAPDQQEADALYCNIQQFTIVVRSGGGS